MDTAGGEKSPHPKENYRAQVIWPSSYWPICLPCAQRWNIGARHPVQGSSSPSTALAGVCKTTAAAVNGQQGSAAVNTSVTSAATIQSHKAPAPPCLPRGIRDTEPPSPQRRQQWGWALTRGLSWLSRLSISASQHLNTPCRQTAGRNALAARQPI